MCTETANAQESVAAAIKNPATTSSRGGLRERPPPKSRSRQPHHEVGIGRTKRFFFFLPCSSDSCSAHKIGSCCNQKIGDDKFERRPRRAPPPKSRRRQPHDEVGIACTKRFVFQKKLATSGLMMPHFVSNDLLGRGSQPVGKWLL
jgi:hypothetical protein